MTSKNNKIFIDPILDEVGRLVYPVHTYPSSDEMEAVLRKVPSRVVPVIFLPGVMGSNLRGVGDSQIEEIWRLDGVSSLLGWAMKDARERKNILNPDLVQVDPRGKVESNEAESGYFRTRQERGWGEVGAMNYGGFLGWLQSALHDLSKKPSSEVQLHRKQAIGKQNLELDDISKIKEALSREEVSLSYRYLLPVHAIGYNWLESNAKSAERVSEQVDKIIDEYRASGRMCEKVILVTHSMGGLVARHYSEKLGGKEKILGVVHGVIPALGAASAYQRMKMGMGQSGIKGSVANKILGQDAEEMTAVLSQSPGSLQLLPGSEYGMGWLKINDNGKEYSLPESDPYKEIYTVRDKWWGLCDERLINPNNTSLESRKLEQDWRDYKLNLTVIVKPFIEGLKNCYNHNTHLFYGAGISTYSDVLWENIRRYKGVDYNEVDTLSGRLEFSELKKINSGSSRRIHSTSGSSLENPELPQTFVLRDPDVNKNQANQGDGTVPVHSARVRPGDFLQSGMSI
ncbi:MAG: hypothetical protein GXZ10_12420 [Gammaproteobacteria bacterium]|nr:hypothetical protein [Gammaproteobacteria bacterium]